MANDTDTDPEDSFDPDAFLANTAVGGLAVQSVNGQNPSTLSRGGSAGAADYDPDEFLRWAAQQPSFAAAPLTIGGENAGEPFDPDAFLANAATVSPSNAQSSSRQNPSALSAPGSGGVADYDPNEFLRWAAQQRPTANASFGLGAAVPSAVFDPDAFLLHAAVASYSPLPAPTPSAAGDISSSYWPQTPPMQLQVFDPDRVDLGPGVASVGTPLGQRRLWQSASDDPLSNLIFDHLIPRSPAIPAPDESSVVRRN